MRPDAIVTDGGSVKGSVVADALAAFGRMPPRLVPGHPIAGTERSGVDASFAELYRDRRVILTPLAETDPAAVERVDWMWRTCGAEVSRMSVAHHDEVLAATSHLPHMLAFGLVDALARMDETDEIFRYAAGGFRDFTRIASIEPGHVAGHLHRQPRGPVRHARPLQRRTDRPGRGHPPRRRRSICSRSSSAPRRRGIGTLRSEAMPTSHRWSACCCRGRPGPPGGGLRGRADRLFAGGDQPNAAANVTVFRDGSWSGFIGPITAADR